MIKTLLKKERKKVRKNERKKERGFMQIRALLGDFWILRDWDGEHVARLSINKMSNFTRIKTANCFTVKIRECFKTN